MCCVHEIQWSGKIGFAIAVVIVVALVGVVVVGIGAAGVAAGGASEGLAAAGLQALVQDELALTSAEFFELGAADTAPERR